MRNKLVVAVIIALMFVLAVGCAGGTATPQDIVDEYDNIDYTAETADAQASEPEPMRPRPPTPEPQSPEPYEPDESKLFTPEKTEPPEPPEIFWIEGEGYTIAWRVLPTLEYERIYQCNCLDFFIEGQSIDTTTGQLTESYHNGHGGHMSMPFVFDLERGLFGHPGVNTDGVPFMIDVHPLDEFEDSLLDSGLLDNMDSEWFFQITRRFFAVENVDSTLRERLEERYGGFIMLTPNAHLGSFALMYNRELLTDFIFDEVPPPYSLAGPARRQGNWGVMNNQGCTIVPFVFEHILLINEHTAFAKYDGTYGILDLRYTLEALQNQ